MSHLQIAAPPPFAPRMETPQLLEPRALRREIKRIRDSLGWARPHWWASAREILEEFATFDAGLLEARRTLESLQPSAEAVAGDGGKGDRLFAYFVNTYRTLEKLAHSVSDLRPIAIDMREMRLRLEVANASSSDPLDGADARLVAAVQAVAANLLFMRDQAIRSERFFCHVCLHDPDLDRLAKVAARRRDNGGEAELLLCDAEDNLIQRFALAAEKDLDDTLDPFTVLSCVAEAWEVEIDDGALVPNGLLH